jgi:hypothetical protein
MVKDFVQTFEGGADGTNVTATSSAAGGDAFSTIILNSGTDVTAAGNAFFTHNSAAAIVGARGAAFNVTGVTNNSYAAWLMPTGNGRRAVMRYPISIPSNPAVTQILSRIDTQSGIFSQMKINTSGKLTISAGSPNADIVASTSTFTQAFNTRYWIEHAVTIGTTTSNGVVEYRLITNSKTDGTGVDTIVASYSNTAQNMGTDAEFGGAVSRFRFYSPFANSGWTTIQTDLWRARITSSLTDWLGPYINVTPPTTTTTGTNNRSVIVATTADGTSPYTFSIAQVSGPAGTASLVPGTSNVWSVPTPNLVDSVWRVTSVDSDGTESTSDYTVPHATGGTAPIGVKKWDGAAWID